MGNFCLFQLPRKQILRLSLQKGGALWTHDLPHQNPQSDPVGFKHVHDFMLGMPVTELTQPFLQSVPLPCQLGIQLATREKRIGVHPSIIAGG